MKISSTSNCNLSNEKEKKCDFLNKILGKESSLLCLGKATEMSWGKVIGTGWVNENKIGSF